MRELRRKTRTLRLLGAALYVITSIGALRWIVEEARADPLIVSVGDLIPDGPVLDLPEGGTAGAARFFAAAANVTALPAESAAPRPAAPVPVAKAPAAAAKPGTKVAAAPKLAKADAKAPAAPKLAKADAKAPAAPKPAAEVLAPGGLALGPAAAASSSVLASGVTAAARGRMSLPSRGAITSRFGPRRMGSHHGLDLSAPVGTPVKAALAGVVTFAGWRNSIYGNFVSIKHGNGLETRYAHNSKVLVRVGQRVSQGQVVARSGNTGRTTGPHIHFEVLRNGQAVNPLNYAR